MEEEAYLTDLRNQGYSYDYIEGVRDSYYLIINSKYFDTKDN